jgi:anti-anti-sigma regulatory factor
MEWLVPPKRGIAMATNFRISVHGKSKGLHVSLRGDFDGISAHELLAFLKKYSHPSSTLFINAGSLGDIHPFGVRVFQGNLNVLNGQSLTLVFTGRNALRLTPEQPMPYDLTISTGAP